MKSKVLKIRNLPEEMQVLNEVKVKPIGSLLVLMLVSGFSSFRIHDRHHGRRSACDFFVCPVSDAGPDFDAVYR